MYSFKIDPYQKLYNRFCDSKLLIIFFLKKLILFELQQIK